MATPDRADRESPLISDEYLSQQRQLHESPGYGTSSHVWAPLVASVLNKTRAGELLDYGCGKGLLARSLGPHLDHKIRVHQYDPAIPECSDTPEPCEVVACTDVLEHIEPDRLDNVLDDLRRVTKGVGVFVIATGPARKVLPDGRNAHLIQEGPEWWLPHLWKRFKVRSFTDCGYNFWVIVC